MQQLCRVALGNLRSGYCGRVPPESACGLRRAKTHAGDHPMPQREGGLRIARAPAQGLHEQLRECALNSAARTFATHGCSVDHVIFDFLKIHTEKRCIKYNSPRAP
jgi:hypothetical protein